MFFFLSKTIHILSYPIIWVLALLLFALFSKTRKRRKRTLISAIVVLYIFSNSLLFDLIGGAWEYPHLDIKDTPHKTYGILLSGFSFNRDEPNDRVHLNKGVDRLSNAIYLFKAGKIDSIIITGGIGKLSPLESEKPEAERIQELLVLFGIPEERIITENNARNTRENAINTAKIISGSDCILITSAFHMRRALGCFHKVGLYPTPFATDFYTRASSVNYFYQIIPSERTFYHWGKFIHEFIGYFTYKVLGYC